MAGWNKWLWGGLGWAMFGPIGGIMGYALGSMAENTQGFSRSQEPYPNQTQTRGGDFGAVILILFAFLVRIITGPLTKKAFLSSQKMQTIQPQLQKLQQ